MLPEDPTPTPRSSATEQPVPIRQVGGSTPPGAATFDTPKFVVRSRIAPKFRGSTVGGAEALSLVTGDRDPLILDCEGIDVEAVRLCTDHDTPLDAEQRCSHGHVARWWRVEVNGKVQYDGRKFSSVEDDVSETYAGPTLALKASTETQAAEGGRGAREGVGGAA